MGYQMIASVGTHALRAGMLAACFGSATATAEDLSSVAPMGGIVLSNDSDGFSSVRVRGGALYSHTNPWRYSGVALQTTRYEQAGYDRDVHGALFIYRDQRRDNLAGVELEAGVVRVAGKTRPVGDATWRFVPREGTAIDLLASADLIDTPLALERAIGAVMGAVGAEQQLGERFTVTGMAGLQSFSDGNARTHLRARLIWLALPEHGATLQLRARHYNSGKEDVGRAYFNPDSYQQWLGVAAIRKRGEIWQVSGALGAGRERSAGSDARPSYLAEVRGERPVFGDGRLVLNAGYYRAAGVFNTANYAYRQVGMNVIVPLR